MNFQLTKEQEFVRKMVREFATNEVEPLAADIDKEHRFPVETVEKMAKYGMLGVTLDRVFSRLNTAERAEITSLTLSQ